MDPQEKLYVENAVVGGYDSISADGMQGIPGQPGVIGTAGLRGSPVRMCGFCAYHMTASHDLTGPTWLSWYKWLTWFSRIKGMCGCV